MEEQPSELVEASASQDVPAASPDVPEVPPSAQADGVPDVPPSAQADGDPSREAPAAEASAAPPTPAKPAPKKRFFRRDAVLVRAFRTGLPVDGVVEKVIKGGYEVRVRRSRGFCPHSQMGLERVEQPEDFVGKTQSFRITEMRRGGEELILSRRALLEEARNEEAKSVRATLLEGAVMSGRVARLADFGAFVDLGAGVIGLVHVTELAHGRVGHPSEAVQIGDRVSARILKLDEATGRISLSIRQAQDDPWTAAGKTLEVGATVTGIVRRIADFGAFVEIQRGVEALAPAREFPPTEGGFERALTIGATRDWIVLAIDVPRRRISIGPIPEPGHEGPVSLEIGGRFQGRVQKVERFGIFVWLSPGQIGLVPTAWSGARSAAEAATKFPVGREVDVEVVDIQEEGRRIRLGVAGVSREAPPERLRRDPSPREPSRRREREEPPRRDEKSGSDASAPAASFGTNLGDALRAAFVKKDS